MAKYQTNITIQAGRDTLAASQSGTYNEVLSTTQIVDNEDGFVNLVSGSTGKGSATLSDCKGIIIKNSGISGAEIQFKSYIQTHGTPDTTGSGAFQTLLLGAGDFVYLPNIRQSNASADHSSANAYTLNDQAPDGNMYVALNNAAAGDAQLVAEAIDGSETEIDVDEGGYFFVGDLIRVENEVMEVRSISSNTLTVIRGSHGSSAASHSDDTAIRLPFFNAFADFDKYSTAQTDGSGRYKSTNFFGYGRNTDGSGNKESMGIVPGSVSGKFYTAGYQELGLSGITASTHTGLSASTTYYFKIQVDGSSALEISFTTDSSNLNFGGKDGLISKIQSALDTQIYTESHLYEKPVTVGIVGGDIRFTSHSHLSTSAIELSAGTSGTANTDEFFDGSNAIGRIPASPEAKVAARLPDDTILSRKSGLEIPNVKEFFYDDGFGNLHGMCQGTINYSSGAIVLQNAPTNANFVVSANYGSGHSGGNRYASTEANSIIAIAGRSTNSKINTTIEIIGLN